MHAFTAGIESAATLSNDVDDAKISHSRMRCLHRFTINRLLHSRKRVWKSSYENRYFSPYSEIQLAYEAMAGKTRDLQVLTTRRSSYLILKNENLLTTFWHFVYKLKFVFSNVTQIFQWFFSLHTVQWPKTYVRIKIKSIEKSKH